MRGLLNLAALRDLLWKGEGQRFFEGEIVRVNNDLIRGENDLVIPFWHLRTAQEGPTSFRYFSQAFPIGCWPMRFAWLEECQLEPTGLTWPVVDFDEQDAFFVNAGRGGWRAARREPPEKRSPLPVELDLARRLEELGISCKGVPGWVYRERLAQLAC